MRSAELIHHHHAPDGWIYDSRGTRLGKWFVTVGERGTSGTRVWEPSLADVGRIEAVRWRLVERINSHWRKLQALLNEAVAAGVTVADRPATENGTEARYSIEAVSKYGPGPMLVSSVRRGTTIQCPAWGAHIGRLDVYHTNLCSRCSKVGDVLEEAIRRQVGEILYPGVIYRLVINGRDYFYRSQFERGPSKSSRLVVSRVAWPDDAQVTRDLSAVP